MKYILLLLLLVLTSCASAPKQRTDKLSILQGVTSNKEVEFNIVAAAGRNLRFELRSAAGVVISPEEMLLVNRPDSAWVVHKVLFLRDQAQDYNLYVYENTKVVDQRLIGANENSPLR